MVLGLIRHARDAPNLASAVAPILQELLGRAASAERAQHVSRMVACSLFGPPGDHSYTPASVQGSTLKPPKYAGNLSTPVILFETLLPAANAKINALFR